MFSLAWAENTVKFPIAIESGKKMASVNTVNPKIKAKGGKEIPEYIVVADNKNSVEAAVKVWESFSELEEQANKLIGSDFALTMGTIPGGADTKGVYTCYTGDPEKVVGITTSVAGTLFTEQYTVQGWKYKQKTVLDQYFLRSYDSEKEALAYLNKNSKMWRKWRGKGEAVLILAAYSDDGDDVNSVLIYRCP